jgi:ribosomal protein S18 acetylase RimI-like enzyme
LKLIVEAATEADAELERAMAVLIPQLNPALAIPTRQHLAAMIAEPTTTLLIASEGSSIVGTATVIVFTSPARVKARIEDVVVDESARGRGVGEALVRECLNVARKRGARVVELESAKPREAANRLYVRMGFELRETNVFRINLV